MRENIMIKNAFLFVTHEINDEILNRYDKLRQETKDRGQSFFLFHKEEDNDKEAYPIPSNITPYVFNVNTLDKLNYKPIEETITPGSNHFATLQFFLDNPGFDYYWVIEYDVVYTGNWIDLFLTFNSFDADFISSHIERFPDKPSWYWWGTLHLEDVVLQQHQLISSFNPIYRLSRNALGFLDNLLKGRKNWGHHEVLIPTALKHWGFKLLDFGGSGEFVLPRFNERFYFSESQWVDGTMRATPGIGKEELFIKNKLLHPVKTTWRVEDQDNNSPKNILANNGLQQKNIHLNNEILWAHIFEDTIRSSSWLTYQSFSPGRWAAGYPMLYLIYRILQGIKPRSILELGLGESSKLTIQYVRKHSEVHLDIFEQDSNWLDFFEKEMPDASLYTIISPVVQVPVEYNLRVSCYESLLETIKDHIYDFIIIDGPWGSPWHSRNQIIEIVEQNLLAQNFMIIMDDYHRRGEKQTVNALFDALSKKNISYVSGVYSGTKDTIVICSECYRFVRSL